MVTIYEREVLTASDGLFSTTTMPAHVRRDTGDSESYALMDQDPMKGGKGEETHMGYSADRHSSTSGALRDSVVLGWDWSLRVLLLHSLGEFWLDILKSKADTFGSGLLLGSRFARLLLGCRPHLLVALSKGPLARRRDKYSRHTRLNTFHNASQAYPGRYAFANRSSTCCYRIHCWRMAVDARYSNVGRLARVRSTQTPAYLALPRRMVRFLAWRSAPFREYNSHHATRPILC